MTQLAQRLGSVNLDPAPDGRLDVLKLHAQDKALERFPHLISGGNGKPAVLSPYDTMVGHVPWQQPFDPIVRAVCNVREHGTQICVGVEAVELGRTDETPVMQSPATRNGTQTNRRPFRDGCTIRTRWHAPPARG